MQLFWWGVNYKGTIRLSRKGLHGEVDDEKPFANLKKTQENDYDPIVGGAVGKEIPKSGKKKKYQGCKKGTIMNKKIVKPILVTVQKDSEVMIVAGNSVPMKDKGDVLRYDKMKNEQQSTSV